MKAILKKVLSMGLVVALTAGITITGTLAYLTDRDSEANVFTVGNVSIDLTEDFEQGATLIPGVDIKKEPTITNIGMNDAWVWATVAVPTALDDDDASKNVVHFNYEKDYVTDEKWTWKDANDDWMIEPTTINNVAYNVYTVLYQTALQKGDKTEPVITNVYMDTNVDIAPNGDWYKVVNGEATKLYWNSNTDGNPIIYVNAYAMQKEEFETVQDAYAAYKSQWASNGTGYAKPVTVSTNEELKNALSANEENIVVTLAADVTYDVATWSANGMGGATTESILINGNGYTLTFNQTDSDWDNVVTNNGAVLTIFDANITNAGYNDGPWNRHDINFACDVVLNNVVSDKALAFKADATLNNVTISDANTSDTYAIWIQPNGQTVTLNGCTIDMIDCTDGRGIKIDEQYVSAPEKVTLNVSNTVFKTEKKSAILVKSIAGADIKLDNVDIYGVAADPIHAVWVDEESAAYENFVTVIGGSKVIEGGAKEFEYVDTNEELDEALKAGKDVILTSDIETASPVSVTGGTLDGAGNTLDSDYAGTSDWGQYAITVSKGGYVKNIKVIDAFRGIGSTNTSEDIYIDNVTIDNVTYAINGNGNGTASVYVTNSTIYGWLSYADIALFSFEDCTVGKGNSYDGYMVVYGDTSFTNVTFTEFDMCADDSVKAGSTVTFTNCTNDGVKVTAENFKELFMYPGDETDFNKLKNCTIIVDGVKVQW